MEFKYKDHTPTKTLINDLILVRNKLTPIKSYPLYKSSH